MGWAGPAFWSSRRVRGPPGGGKAPSVGMDTRGHVCQEGLVVALFANPRGPPQNADPVASLQLERATSRRHVTHSSVVDHTAPTRWLSTGPLWTSHK